MKGKNADRAVVERAPKSNVKKINTSGIRYFHTAYMKKIKILRYFIEHTPIFINIQYADGCTNIGPREV